MEQIRGNGDDESDALCINDHLDLLIEVLKRLDGRSLGVAACVCRQWRSIARNDSLWEHLCFRHVSPPPIGVRPVVSALGGYRRLYMVCVRPVVSRLKRKRIGGESEVVRRVWKQHEVELSLSLFCVEYYERLLVGGGRVAGAGTPTSSLKFLCCFFFSLTLSPLSLNCTNAERALAPCRLTPPAGHLDSHRSPATSIPTARRPPTQRPACRLQPRFPLVARLLSRFLYIYHPNQVRFSLLYTITKNQGIIIHTQNRLKGEGSSTHTGGSISYHEHAKKLESTLKRPPTPFELFLHTHTKGHDNRTFINARSRIINDNMLRLRQTLLQNQQQQNQQQNHASGPAGAAGAACAAGAAGADGATVSMANESTLYHEAAGGVKKRRVYGRGPIGREPTRCGNATTASKENEGWKDKCLTMERRVEKLTRKNKSLEETLEIVCQRIGVPIVRTENEDGDEGPSVADARENTNGSHSEADTSEDHHDTPI